MAAPSEGLCSICSAVDFRGLLYPRGAEPGGNLPQVPLGCVADIIQRAAQCRLCDLIVDGLRRRYKHSVEQGALDTGFGLPPSPGGRDRRQLPQEDLPTVLFGEPIQCSLAPSFFCFQTYSAAELPEPVRPSSIYRLVVRLAPCPWQQDSSKDGVTLQAHWDRDAEDDQEAAPAGGEGEVGEPAPSMDRRIAPSGSGRQVPPLVDSGRLRGWLGKCEEEHGDRCSSPPWLGAAADMEQLPSLRVVDVQNRCIVDASDACRYIALSYVWGNSQAETQKRSQRSTNRANFLKLQEPGGLDSISLPRTVVDAMTLVAAIGERYLWVDALCIVQDDVSEMVHQIAKMDLVYSGALMTFIVAAGADADAGLPGFGDAVRDVSYKRVAVAADGLGVISTASLAAGRTLQFSPWNTRGWTYQERLLSRRALVITQDLVYWNCETSTWNEETILEPEHPPVWVLPQALGCNDEWDDGYPKFSREALGIYITQYSERQFSYSSDALPAFMGLARRYEHRTGDILHWGVECSRFDQSLMWRHGTDRMMAWCYLVLDDGSIQPVRYPSWSWLGWSGFKGANIFNDGLYERTVKGESRSELDFYSLMSDGQVKRVGRDLSTSVPDDGSVEVAINDDPIHRARLQWKGDTSISGPVTTNAAGAAELPALVEHLSLGERVTSDAAASAGTPVHDTGRLAFRTSCARILSSFGAQSMKLHVDISGAILELSSSFSDPSPFLERRRISHLSADTEDDVSDDIGKIKSNESDDEGGVEDPGTVVLASATMPIRKIPIDYIVVSRHYPIGERNDVGMLNLMAVKWSETEPGVASRIGTAVIDEQEWIKTERVWKTVILE